RWCGARTHGQPALRHPSPCHRLRPAFRRAHGLLRDGIVAGKNAVEQNLVRQPCFLYRDGTQMKTSTQPRQIIIVGGVAGGASAAAKARRVDENAEIHVFERGPFISFANCGLPYFIAGEIDDRAKLIIMTPEKFWPRSRVHAHVNHEVLSIDRAAKTIRVKGPAGATRDVAYDKLILS